MTRTRQKPLPVAALDADRVFVNGRGYLRIEARRPGRLSLVTLDEGELGRLALHPSRVRRIALECGAALDVAEVLGRLTGIRAMVLDEVRGKPVPLDLPGVDGRTLRLAPGRVRRSGPTLALTERGADGRPVAGTAAEVQVPAASFPPLARALRRWGLEALDA